MAELHKLLIHKSRDSVINEQISNLKIELYESKQESLLNLDRVGMLNEDLERIEVFKSNQQKLAMILTEHANIRQKLETELKMSREK